MKKLALALVCLFSVAFFASCDKPIENPKPSISILEEEGFAHFEEIINVGDTVYFGFIVASNAETSQLLSSLVVKIDDEEWDKVDLTGKSEYTYKSGVFFPSEKDTIVGPRVITAVVTDTDGQTNTASINIYFYHHDVQTLEVEPIEWRRDNGADGTGLAEYGLQWTKNVTDKTVAKIEPLEGATLIIFDPEDWTNTNTQLEKAALFTEVIGVSEFKGVSTTASSDYDLVIGTIYNGVANLIHITHCNVYERGWHFVITGEAK